MSEILSYQVLEITCSKLSLNYIIEFNVIEKSIFQMVQLKCILNFGK
jgi:hypothetical protein